MNRFVLVAALLLVVDGVGAAEPTTAELTPSVTVELSGEPTRQTELTVSSNADGIEAGEAVTAQGAPGELEPNQAINGQAEAFGHPETMFKEQETQHLSGITGEVEALLDEGTGIRAFSVLEDNADSPLQWIAIAERALPATLLSADSAPPAKARRRGRSFARAAGKVLVTVAAVAGVVVVAVVVGVACLAVCPALEYEGRRKTGRRRHSPR